MKSKFGQIPTKQERAVLTLLCDGKTTKDIAIALGVSPRTVDSYRDILSQKLLGNAQGGTINLWMKAVQLGLVVCPCQKLDHDRHARAAVLSNLIDEFYKQFPPNPQPVTDHVPTRHRSPP